MHKRLGTIALGLGLAGALVALPAAGYASTSMSTATLNANILAGSVGARTIQSVTPGAMTSALGSPTLSTTLAVVVDEAAVSGDANGWTVTVQSSPFTDSGTDTIVASALSDSANTAIPVCVGCTETVTGPATPGTLDAARTLISTTGELNSVLYTGTYTSNSSLVLTPPNGTVAANYHATLTVTLTQ
ncbi:MAG TPA: hypothetical protein VF954_00085 [Acidimicrobiales bacterium]